MTPQTEKSPADSATSPFCQIIGAVGRVNQGGSPTKQIAHVDFDSINLQSGGISTKMKHTVDGNTEITSPYVLKLSIERSQTPSIQGLLGPTYTSGDAAKGKPAYIDVPSQGHITPMSGFYLMNGWLFLTGPQPVAKTDYVAAGADGCEVAVDIRGAITRVYFLKSKSAGRTGWYQIINPAGSRVNVAYPDKYVEIDTSGPPTASEARDIDPNDPFLKDLREIQACAGLPF